MKRYVWLYSLTIIIVVSMFAYCAHVKYSISEVETMTLSLSSIDNTVTCCGKVEYAESNQVCYELPSIINKIYVKVGDKVKLGDDLVCINGVDPQSYSNGLSEIEDSTGGIKSILGIDNSYNSIIDNVLAQRKTNNKFISDGTTNYINSKCEGVVSSLYIKEGQCVEASSPMMVISDINKLQVKLSVNESQISDIKIGQKVNITGVGFKSKSYAGTVKYISNEAKQTLNGLNQTSTIDVIVDIKKPDHHIKPGYTAKCSIITSNDKDILIIPYDCVKADESGNEYLYVYRGGEAIKQYIKTGKEYSKGLQIIRGVKPGQTIITRPVNISNKKRVKSVGVNMEKKYD